ncbi:MULTISPECIES: hypothetical protein [Paenibacillus]|uniref:LexA repressor DNA-binding domain-containing protein n=1 Tax=Paenibacillus odorifer TaxID=189426 RepID=A0A1R0X1P8_9BACL|nr:hypothetical protein [Paenibacillus odorifer]OMD26756.1 hypothetical protein BJP51_26560 [Paenibacillus odorifer]OME30623.1 hypothetical protein BSK63_17165 [Paenibacillus odorifer]
MLSDTARKLLMIMRHSSVHHSHMPTLQELEIKSGRTADKIYKAFKELVDEDYIEWEPHSAFESAVIIEGWERPDPRFKTSQTCAHEVGWGLDGGNIEYWTKY